ncbi:MAG: MFS transporter [Candidatus Aminicenantes bacterium]|nr:MFS transporter [Candidatus Aminicenantes bacterium]
MKQKWMILTLAFFMAFSYFFVLQSYPPMIPQVMEEFDLSHVNASLPMSLVSLAGIFLALPTWAFIFRWGLKKIGALGLVICSIGGMISSLGSSFLLIVLGRVILGIGGVLIIVVSFSIVANWFTKEEGGRAMGIKGLDLPIATILALNLLPIVITIHGWRASFTVSTVLLIISTAFFIFLFREKPLRESGTKMFEGIWNKQMWLLGITWSFVTISIVAYSTWAGTFFIELWKIPVNVAFFMASILMIGMILLSAPIGYLSDRLGKRKIFLIFSFLLMGISLILIPILPGSFLYLAIALLAISGFSAPIIHALTPEILPRERAGLGFGILFTCSFIGTFIGPILVGFVKDLFPGGGPAFFTMGAFPLLSLICTKFLKVR